MKIPTTADTIANIYKDNYSWLYNWLCKSLGSKDQAEDVLHDTFLKIIRSKDIFSIRTPHSYLHSTAKRIVIDQARRKKVEQAYLNYLSEFQDDAISHSPEHIALAIETLDQMALVLSNLDDRARQILLMHYIEDVPQGQIAKLMNISIKTVQRDLMKGLMHCHRHDVL